MMSMASCDILRCYSRLLRVVRESVARPKDCDHRTAVRDL